MDEDIENVKDKAAGRALLSAAIAIIVVGVVIPGKLTWMDAVSINSIMGIYYLYQGNKNES